MRDPDRTQDEPSDVSVLDRGRGAEWRRRHAETKPREKTQVVRADPPEDDWTARHSRCS